MFCLPWNRRDGCHVLVLCVSFIKKTQEGNVCYCTYIGLKNITRCIEL